MTKTMLPKSRRFAVAFLAWAVVFAAIGSTDASAQEWQDAYPGVRYLEKTISGPVEIRAVEVDLGAPGVRLRATGPDESGRTVSSFGEKVGAQVVINGDFYEPDFSPTGFAMGDGKQWADDNGTWGFIAFGQKRAEIFSPGERVSSVPDWVENAVGGNQKVLKAGQPTDDAGSFCQTRHPRTTAGLSEDGARLYLVVADGRSEQSQGMTCTELGDLMKSLGAHDALNLDGGGSTTMWRDDKGVVNRPSQLVERAVGNHLAVHADGDDDCGDEELSTGGE